MTPKKTFCYYNGLHLHFCTEKYSILKYGPDTASSRKKYDSMSEGQRHRFVWMCTKFQTTQDVVYAVIASELAGLDAAYCNKQEILDAYYDFKSRRESISRILSTEFIKYESDPKGFRELLFAHFCSQYSPEFILLMDSEKNYLQKAYDSTELAFARPKILKLIKYKNFFSPSKYIHIVNHENTVSA